MARIVPAKPRCETQPEERALLLLERALDDDYVIFQRRPAPGLLVAHPERGFCVVLTPGGVRTFDPDAACWDGADLDAAARATSAALAAIAAPLGATASGAAALLSETDPSDDDGDDPRVAFSEEALVSAVTAAMAGPPPGEAGIDQIIAAVSRGAAPYARGQITAAQQTWRTSAGQTPPPVAPPPIASPPPAAVQPEPVIPSAPAVAHPPVVPQSPFPPPPPPGALFSPPGFEESDFGEAGFTESAPAFPMPGFADPPDSAAEAAARLFMPGFADAAPNPMIAMDVVPAGYERVADDPTPLAAPDLVEDDVLIQLLRQAVDTVADGRPIFVAGVMMSANDVVAPDFLLPAIIVAAAEDWAPIVASRGGKGGFLVRLRSDPEALLGYRVTALTPATPFLMMLPVVDRLRRSFIVEKGEFEVDDSVAQFARWLSVNRFDTEFIADIDVRVALSMPA